MELMYDNVNAKNYQSKFNNKLLGKNETLHL